MIADYSSETKLRYFNSFRNAKVTNEYRRQIAAESRQKFRVLTA